MDLKGARLEKFDLRVGMAFEKLAIPIMKLANQTSTGVMYFDRAAGQLRRCEWKVDSVDSKLDFIDGEAEGRMVLSVESSFGPRSREEPRSSTPDSR